MILLLKNKTLNKYRTIWESDKEQFLKLLYNEKIFKQYPHPECEFLTFPRWEIVADKSEVKKTLKENFSSKGRGGQYQAGLPSTTVVVDTLYPVDLKKERFKLSWLNNVSEEDFYNQEEKNKESMNLGTYLHKILELYLLSELPKHKKDVRIFVEQARSDKEVLKIFPDFEERRIALETMVAETVSEFISRELCEYICLGSEIFFNTGRLQGTVDMVGLKSGCIAIQDFKSTRKSYPNGTPKFTSPNDMDSYVRQLCSYKMALEETAFISPIDIKNLEFKVYQFNLLNCKYKIFKKSSEEVLGWEDSINCVLNWFHESVG